MKNRFLILSLMLATNIGSHAYAGKQCNEPKKPKVVDVCDGLPMDSLVNGSFEQLNSTVGNQNGYVQNQIVSLKSWDQFNVVKGWTSLDQTGIELWGGGFLGFQPTDGKVLLEIKGRQPNVIAQDFCSKGGYRDIALDVAARTGLFGDNVVNVSIDGAQVLHIDPAHSFFKTYSVGLNLTKGKHTIQLSSETGTNSSMGGLIDNVRLETDCKCHIKDKVGVSTILMALSEVDAKIAKSIIDDQMKFVRPVKNPKVLFVRSIYNAGESLNDFVVIPQMIGQLGYTVTSIDEPQTGLSAADVDGYDVVWFNNPGYPAQSPLTLQTLYNAAHSENTGVVLSGDDMSSNQIVNMPALTLLDYGNNGTGACGQAIDNNATSAKYVVKYKGDKFLYGNDIDQDVAHGKYRKVSRHRISGSYSRWSGVQIFATAKTTIIGCSLEVPAIAGYKIR
jgi:hypothetical protein